MKKLFTITLGLMLILAFAGQVYAKTTTKPTQRAVYHNNQGVRFLEARDLTRAEFEFKTAMELSPDYSEAYNNLGILYKMKGNLESARVFFEKAVELDKSYASAYSHLSMVYLDLGDLSKALKYGKIAASRGSTMPLTHFNLALVYIDKDRLNPEKSFEQHAEHQLKIATELDPHFYEGHVALARLYSRQGRYELSAIRYRLALGNKPTEAKIWNELGNVYKSMGDSAKAENAFRKGLSITKGQKSSSTPHMALGLQHMSKKDYRKAMEEFKKAVEQNPDDYEANYQMGTACLNLGEVMLSENRKDDANKFFEVAEKYLKKAEKLNPKDTDAPYNLGLVYYRMGKFSTAEESWKKALSIDSTHPRSLFNLGMLYNEQKNSQKTIEYLCKFANVSGQEYSGEKATAIKIIEMNGGKCQS